MTWGNNTGIVHTLRIAGCGSDPSVGNAYAGGSYLRSSSACVPLIFSGTRPRRFYAQPGLIATVLRYRGSSVLLAELQGDQMGLTKKFAAPDTRVEPAPIGSFGIWLEGGKHVLIWEVGSGEIRQLERRLAGNVLVWTEGDRTYRLEGGLNMGQMLELGRHITR